MKKLKLQGFFLIMLSVWVLISIVRIFLNQHPESIKTVSPPGARSEIGAKENVQSRREYEEMRLTNPNTGEVPLDIRKQELNFAKAQFAEAQRNRIARLPAGTDASENAEALDWIPVGPENFGGRTRALAIDVTDERTLLAEVFPVGSGGLKTPGQVGKKPLHPISSRA